MVRRHRGHSGLVLDIAMSADGKHLASGGEDRTIRIWDLDSGRHVQLPEQPEAVQAVAFSPDGKTLASAQGLSVKIWDASDGRPLGEVQGQVAMARDLAFSPDNRTFVSAGNNGVITLWDIKSGELLKRWLQSRDGSAINAVAFSPDGRRLVSGGDDQMATLWDVSDGSTLGVSRGHTGPVLCVAFSPDGETLVSGSNDSLIKIWNRRSTGHPRVLAEHSAVVNGVRYSPMAPGSPPAIGGVS